MPGSTDLEKAQHALATVPVESYARKGSKAIAEVVARIGDMNLAVRRGGGKYPRGVASVFAREGKRGWEAVLQTPFMGMEWGGWVTNVFGRKIGSARSQAIGLKPMWAPWHGDYAKGYIISAAWIELDKGKATAEMADAVLAAYTQVFDEAGLKRGQ